MNMDCEKFESTMMEELYGELDELTSAAAKRHVAGCARCTALLGGLRATRRLASLPLVEPPADLEERILAAGRHAQKVVPLRRRLASAISLAGGWAMRPQTAMAALFLVMIGTSVLLLRGKSARAPASAEVTVTEEGTPAPAASGTSVSSPLGQPQASATTAYASPVSRAPEPRAALPAPAPTAAAELGPDDLHARAKAGPAKDEDGLAALRNASVPGGVANALPPAVGPGGAGAAGGPYAAPPQPAQQASVAGSPFDTALQMYRSGRFDDAARAFDALSPGDPNADLWAARSIREGKGCRSALLRFDKVSQRASGTAPGWDALLEGANCYRSTGDFGAARVRLNALLKVDSHKDRAQAELDRLTQMQQSQGTAGAGAAKASPKKPAATPTATGAADSAY